jgi:S1-C subfamily serine protease
MALVMVMTALGILVATGDGSNAASAPTRAPLELGVVGIDARIGEERVRSSGTVVDARAGLVVTSAHTVWGATSLRLMTGLGVLHGRLVARAPCANLAVIEVQPRIPGLVALPAATTSDGLLTAVGRRDDALVTIPLRAESAAASAAVEAGLPPLESAIRLDAAVVPESSGGPVVNENGEVVGMAMATVAGSGAAGAVAMPWSTIEDRLAELAVDDRRIYVGWREYYRCAPALHDYARREHPGYTPADAVINAPVPATRLPGTQGLDSR